MNTLKTLLAAVVLVATLSLVESPAAAQPGTLGQLTETEISESGGEPEVNTITAYGPADDLGPSRTMQLNAPLVGMTGTATGNGYWLVASDGGIFTFGDASFHGSAGSIPLNEPIVGMTATADGGGYWLVASDGGVFTYGNALFHGSMGGTRLNKPVVGMAATPTGDGYWLVAKDGGIFSFGDAQFFGSTGSMRLNQPVNSMAATPTGDGYWLVAKDGGIFTFGDAEFLGSQASNRISSPVIGMAASSDDSGYWLAAENGEVFAFGPDDYGSANSNTSYAQPRTVAIAPAVGGGYWLTHGQLRAVNVQQSGPHVAALQRRLETLGYWVGPIDGVYGELTKQALYAFQKVEGLPINGEADAQTAARLQQASRPQPRSTSGDLMELDKTRQVILFVRGGKTEWVFNTSTGTEKPYEYKDQTYLADTPTGRFNFYHQVDAVQIGPLGRLYRPKYFHTDGIAIHGSSYVPPEPVSHGCARMTNAAIDFVWEQDLAPMGSPVWVYGTSPV